jgi:hypothetical protein
VDSRNKQCPTENLLVQNQTSRLCKTSHRFTHLQPLQGPTATSILPQMGRNIPNNWNAVIIYRKQTIKSVTDLVALIDGLHRRST